MKHRKLWIALAALAAWIGAATAAQAASSNRDIYLEQDTPPEQVKPTVKFWAEKVQDGSRDIEYVLDGNSDQNVFKTGQKAYFKFSSNVECYAYLANKGSSGKVSLLYPGISGRDNKVPAYETRIMPSSGQPFVFAGPPGQEELCLVVSPAPIPDFETLAADPKTRSIDLTEGSMKEVWEKTIKSSAEMGKTRDLVLEQDPGAPGQPAANYATDFGSEGFTRPLTIYMTLRHEP